MLTNIPIRSSEVYLQLGDRAWGQILEHVFYQVEDRIDDQVWNPVGDQVKRQVVDSMRAACQRENYRKGEGD